MKIAPQSHFINNLFNTWQPLLEGTNSLFAISDMSRHFVKVNRLFSDVFNTNQEAMIGKPISDCYDSNAFKNYEHIEAEIISNMAPIETEVDLFFHGRHGSFKSIYFPVTDQSGKLSAIACVLRSTSDNDSISLKLEIADRIISQTKEGIVITTANGVIVDINEAYCRITGYDREELIGQKPSLLKSGRHDNQFYDQMWRQINETGFWSGEIWDRRKNGEIYPKCLRISTLYKEDGSVKNYMGIFTDISDQKRAEDAIENLAYTDPLTQLPNRSLFYDRLNQSITAIKREQGELAVMIIDIGRFKFINCNLGHSAGDELLIHVAKELSKLVRASDTVARLNADEFAIVLPALRLPEDALIVAQNILTNICKKLQLNGEEIEITLNIGISCFPQDGANGDLLVKQAELALYKSRELGSNNYHFFSIELQDAIEGQLELENELRTAIQQNQLTLFYQPKIDLISQKVVGMEALVRWNHPEKGMIPPDKFIPFAEESNLIIEMGQWIIDTACQQTAAWNRQLEEPLVIAINLSPKQFRQSNLLDMIQQSLSKHRLDAHQVELEITESSVMDDVNNAMDIMHQLRSSGLKLAIDDFGTGYSSLSYLKRFPITTLKIDQSFVRELTEDSDDAAIVETIITMAEKLNLNVVAEGIETVEQFRFLQKNNCQNGQGYYLCRPLPSEEFEAFFKRFTGNKLVNQYNLPLMH